MHKAKEITREEARYILMKHLVGMVGYWEKEDRAPSSREKLEGLLHSILAALDGCAMGPPGYHLIPCTSEEDKDFAIKEGFDYYPYVEEDDLPSYDVGGALHEGLHGYFEGKVKKPENLYDFGDHLVDDAKEMREKLKRTKEE